MKRFYKRAEAAEIDGVWTVTLDGRRIKTPAKTPAQAPNRALAEAAAAEWEAQREEIDPAAMPVNRYLNTALDRVAPQREAVIDDIAAYGGSDLLCYRAEAPAELLQRQTAAWDPLLDWARETFAAPLVPVSGVTHVPQPPNSLAALRRAVAEQSDLGLAALHDLTGLSGSLILALATARSRLTPQEAWDASRIDEEWQAEQWGRDAEADATAAKKRADLETAARVLALI